MRKPNRAEAGGVKLPEIPRSWIIIIIIIALVALAWLGAGDKVSTTIAVLAGWAIRGVRSVGGQP